MAVKIKLKRIGKIRVPQYRIVVADARTARGGRAIEELGIYQPKQNPSLIRVDSDRVQYWLSVGAQPTEPVMAILKVTGDWQKFKGLPGAEGTLQEPETKSDKTEIFNQAAKEAVEEKDRVAEVRAAAAKKAAKERAEGEKAEAEKAKADKSDEKPAEDKAKADKSDEKPAEDKAEATEEKPAEDKAEATEEKPAEDKAEATEEKPAEDQAEATEEKPAEDKAEATEEKPAEDSKKAGE